MVDILFFFFFKQKTAYEIYQCDWSSDVCSSDLLVKYHSFELQKIKGKKSGEIEGLLGYKSYDEVIHRNDMVILGKGD